MEWADQERLIRQDLEETDRDLRQRRTERYKVAENAEINITGGAKPRDN